MLLLFVFLVELVVLVLDNSESLEPVSDFFGEIVDDLVEFEIELFVVRVIKRSLALLSQKLL